MTNIYYLAASIAIGVSISMQPPINAVMARTLGSPMLAACFSIAITLIIAILAWLSLGKGGGDFAQIKALPWWVMFGGIVGVFFVVGGVMVAPVVGMALFFVCVVAGQLLGSSVIDHFGAFDLPVKPVNTMKLLGLFMVLAGAILVQNSSS
jgi:transporter family-2 protein